MDQFIAELQYERSMRAERVLMVAAGEVGYGSRTVELIAEDKRIVLYLDRVLRYLGQTPDPAVA